MTPEIKTKLAAKGGKAGALHLESDKVGAVAIWNLSVLIVPDEDRWFAQGLEINYGAQGDTIEEAQEHFQRGLLLTIKQHLRIYGNVERILQFASSEILKEAAQKKTAISRLSQVSFHEILDDVKAQEAVPFDGIDYRVLGSAA